MVDQEVPWPRISKREHKLHEPPRYAEPQPVFFIKPSEPTIFWFPSDSRDFNMKFYNSLGKAHNHCSSIIGKTQRVVIVHSKNRLGGLIKVVHPDAIVDSYDAVLNVPPTLKDLKFWIAEEKKTQKIDHLARSLLIQGFPNDIYSLIDSSETAKDLWDALERQMRGSEYGDLNDTLGYGKKAVVVTSDPLALVAEKTNDQAWMESSNDSYQEINANMVFMAQIKKVLSESDEISSSAEETIAEVSYYTSESKSESEFKTSEYYDNSTNYGLFVNNDDDQEIFHDAIKSASENFIENHIDSQKDYDKSEVDHNDSEEKEHLVDKLIRKTVKCQKHIEKANQQSKDFEN
nr:hypothetical protein [Tanacetum cinerariifolium]